MSSSESHLAPHLSTESVATTGDSINANSCPYISNNPVKPLEEDVCYSPHHRTSEDDAGIDYDALHEYLRTGAVYPTEKHIRKSNSVSNRHLARRDSKGFAGGRPSQSESSRLMFYSKGSGVIHADSFQDLYKVANIPESEAPPKNGKSKADGTNNDEPHPSTFVKLLLGGNFWIDVQAPTEVEMKSLSRIFGIHPLTEEDILMEEEREKCEFFPTYYFVCIRTFDQDHYSPTYMQPILYYMVVMREGIISFHGRQTPHTHNVLKRIEQLRDYIPVTPDWICYALIDDITDSFAPLIRQIDAEVVSIDELVLILKESEQSDMLQRIGHARRNVMAMLRLLIPKPDVIRSLTKRVPSSNDIALYYGDILDHVLSMLSSCNHFESVLGRSHSNYLAQISIEITQSANQTNDVLTKITILGSILLPMNVITGLFGMNVPVPGEKDYTGQYTWFIGICVCLVVFSIGSIIVLRKATTL